MRGRLTTVATIPIEEEVLEVIREEAAKRIRRQYIEAERRILAGEDQVELPYLPDTTDCRTIVFSAPAWRRRPRARLAVELARLRHRYREHQARWGG